MSSDPRLFGTDGVRGVAGQYPLDRQTVWKLGRALATVLETALSQRPLQVLLGEDTRESSAWISRALAAGLHSCGAQVVYAGVLTTPGVAFLTRHHGYSAGVVVSASHNPYEDNGIKVLSGAGTKLPESLELAVERQLDELEAFPAEVPEQLELHPVTRLLDDYRDFLVGLVPGGMSFAGRRLVVDCAHGAASRVIPGLFAQLGIQARILNAEPSGRNINLGCGSLHPEAMASQTKALAADLGVAFDGDADRAMFSTCEGDIRDGDHVLYVAAPFLQQHGELRSQAVVGTLMTNLGLEMALAKHGIGLKRTAVGDKYVLEEMLRSGINLGGEPSGHIIFSDLSLAGDGIITLLQVLRFMTETGESLAELTCGLKLFPQVIRNVVVREKPPLDQIPALSQAIEDCRREFGDHGRVVVRYSGTEPLARVMVEADEADVVERHAARIAGVIDGAVGLH